MNFKKKIMIFLFFFYFFFHLEFLRELQKNLKKKSKHKLKMIQCSTNKCACWINKLQDVFVWLV